MNKLLLIVFLISGIVLIIYGISAAYSFSSDVSNFFTGSPTDKAIWMLILGAVLTVVGLSGMMFRRRT